MKINKMNMEKIIAKLVKLPLNDSSKYKSYLVRRLQTLSDKEIKLMR